MTYSTFIEDYQIEIQELIHDYNNGHKIVELIQDHELYHPYYFEPILVSLENDIFSIDTFHNPHLTSLFNLMYEFFSKEENFGSKVSCSIPLLILGTSFPTYYSQFVLAYK